jgi:hypothetical protein
MLRRWDHRRGIARKKLKSTGVYAVVEDEWLDLEDGVQILFEKSPQGTSHAYRSGDYWLIPARVATGDVEWPGPPDAPESRPPHGVEHHYAPLGLLMVSSDDKVNYQDCRTTFGTTVWSLTTGVADWQVMKDPAGGAVPRAVDVITDPGPARGSIPGALWVSASPTGKGPTGLYQYDLQFDLGSCLRNAGIFFDLLADDTVKVSLNGNVLTPQPGTKHYESSDRSLFVEGQNTLRVELNKTDPAGGPIGFILGGAVEVDRNPCC